MKYLKLFEYFKKGMNPEYFLEIPKTISDSDIVDKIKQYNPIIDKNPHTKNSVIIVTFNADTEQKELKGLANVLEENWPNLNWSIREKMW